MTITMEHYDITVTIEHKREDLRIDEVMEELVKPALFAIGFEVDAISDAQDDAKV